MPDDPNPDHERRLSAEVLKFKADEEADRPRGFLTDRDRQYLWGQKKYEKQASALSQCRQDIRQRTENGLLDLAYLHRLEEGQAKQIYRSLDENAESWEFRKAVASLIEFIYSNVNQPERWIENAVEGGIADAVQPNDSGRWGLTNVTATITIEEPYDVDELEAEFRETGGEALTAEEVGVLVRTGRVEPSDLAELETEMGDNHPGDDWPS